MPVQFFLKHAEVIDLLKHYDPDTTDLHKGLVFSVDFELKIIQNETSQMASPQYLAQAQLYGVLGPYINPRGELTPIPGTLKIACPHPPPCGFVNENFEITKRISDSTVAECYPQ